MAGQRIAILGAYGLLGSRLQHYLKARKDFQLFPLAHGEADVTQPESLRIAFERVKPDWVINSTAFLNADCCEKEPQNSYAVNFIGARHAAEASALCGARLIHFSTDYVFDGKEGGYNEASTARPLSLYGLHKYLADEAIFGAKTPAYILRISSVIGAGEGKPDILKALLGRVASGVRKLEVVQDLKISISTPRFISSVIEQFIDTSPAHGLYNTVAMGQTTWLEAAREAFDELGVSIPFEPISSEAFPRLAPRPRNSWLKTDKLAEFLQTVPVWRTVIREQVRDLKDTYLAVLKKSAAA